MVTGAAIPTEVGGTNHTRAFAASAATPEAHQACLAISKALAAVGVRVLADDVFFAKVRACQLFLSCAARPIKHCTAGEEHVRRRKQREQERDCASHSLGMMTISCTQTIRFKPEAANLSEECILCL